MIIDTVDKLNDLYLTEWRLYLNFFIPSFKLIDKKRIGAKIIKVFSSPLTPYQRIIASPNIKSSVKKLLTKTFNSLDLFILQSRTKNKIVSILRDY